MLPEVVYQLIASHAQVWCEIPDHLIQLPLLCMWMTREWIEVISLVQAVAKKLAELSGKGVTTIIGGGDSVAAVEKVGVASVMSHISTGGGASLELLEGKQLPGVLALDEATPVAV